ncbi:MAG: YbfB/YjiJ family MFS transporter, partial [Lysinibacillus sp.]|nr:YbfB/YjiJ family MFS transporter [Lysinibacillus sp.]
MHKNLFTVLTGGIFSLAIAMGIGRFSYTVILPYMQSTYQFSNSTAGFLATSNYFGYFVGAILSGKMNLSNKRYFYLKLSLITSILTTGWMGLSENYLLWYILRFISGVASAFIFVVASSIVLDVLSNAGKSHLSGIFYSGVGFGIAFSGIIVSPLYRYFDWNGTWIGLAIFSTILLLLIFIWINEKRTMAIQKSGQSTVQFQQLPPARWIKWLIIAYGLEGLGYIITGTFIVSIAETSPAFMYDPVTVWIVTGVAAIPSCIIWTNIAKKIGYVHTLFIIMILQGFGVLLPALSEGAPSLYVSAFLFGATFMGIATLATTLARQILPVNSYRILGFLTASYALGQMIGPSIAGILSTITNSYNYSLLGATIVIFIGASCLISG